jgi:elongation factor 1 alpha-like protein
LPEASGHITDRQIQDALWHYYYDVDKSVAYLIKEYMAKPKKEQKKKVAGGFYLFFPTLQVHGGELVGKVGPEVGFDFVFYRLQLTAAFANHNL